MSLSPLMLSWNGALRLYHRMAQNWICLKVLLGAKLLKRFAASPTANKRLWRCDGLRSHLMLTSVSATVGNWLPRFALPRNRMVALLRLGLPNRLMLWSFASASRLVSELAPVTPIGRRFGRFARRISGIG